MIDRYDIEKKAKYSLLQNISVMFEEIHHK